LLAATRRVGSVLPDDVAVNCAFADGDIHVDAAGAGHQSSFQTDADATYDGDFDGKVSFNPKYLIEALRAMPDETVEVHLNDDGMKPAVFSADDRVVVLMPVRQR